MTTHPLMTAWLDRVAALAANLPPDQRDELLADLEDHLDQSLPSADATAAEVQRVLEALGHPNDIVAAAREDTLPPPPPLPPELRPGLTGAEITVIAGFVTSGFLLIAFPFSAMAWILAVVLLATRARWQGIEKLVALTLPIYFAAPTGLALLPLAAGKCGETVTVGGSGVSVRTTTCDVAFSVGAQIAMVVLLVAGVASVIWLTRRIRRRFAVA